MLLLNTHAFLWFILNDVKLSKPPLSSPLSPLYFLAKRVTASGTRNAVW